MNKFIALTYHSIGDNSGNEYNIRINTFKDQMNWLRLQGYKVEGFREFNKRTTLNEWPDRYVLLTFDDGYKSFLQAANILNDLSFNATFFLTKDWCNNKSNFLVDEEIKELSLTNEIGSHTISHPYLTKIPSQNIKYELSESKKWIQDLIQKDVISLSAPNGYINDNIINIAINSGYKFIGNSIEWWNNNENIYSSNLINRIAIRKSYSTDTFKKIINRDIFYFLVRKARTHFLSIPKSILNEKQYNKIHKLLK